MLSAISARKLSQALKALPDLPPVRYLGQVQSRQKPVAREDPIFVASRRSVNSSGSDSLSQGDS